MSRSAPKGDECGGGTLRGVSSAVHAPISDLRFTALLPNFRMRSSGAIHGATMRNPHLLILVPGIIVAFALLGGCNEEPVSPPAGDTPFIDVIAEGGTTVTLKLQVPGQPPACPESFEGSWGEKI